MKLINNTVHTEIQCLFYSKSHKSVFMANTRLVQLFAFTSSNEHNKPEPVLSLASRETNNVDHNTELSCNRQCTFPHS